MRRPLRYDRRANKQICLGTDMRADIVHTCTPVYLTGPPYNLTFSGHDEFNALKMRARPFRTWVRTVGLLLAKPTFLP